MHIKWKEIERGVLLIWLCFRVDRKMSDSFHKGPLFRCRFHKWQQLFCFKVLMIFFWQFARRSDGGRAITLIFWYACYTIKYKITQFKGITSPNRSCISKSYNLSDISWLRLFSNISIAMAGNSNFWEVQGTAWLCECIESVGFWKPSRTLWKPKGVKIMSKIQRAIVSHVKLIEWVCVCVI